MDFPCASLFLNLHILQLKFHYFSALRFYKKKTDLWLYTNDGVSDKKLTHGQKIDKFII